MYVTLLLGPAAGRAERLEAAAIAREVDDAVARASTLGALAQDALVYGDTAEAELIAAELQALLDDDDTDARLHAGEALAIAYLTLDGPVGDRAVQTFDRLVEIARRAQRQHVVTTSLANVAFLRLCRDEHQAAVDAARAGLDLARDFDESLVVVLLAYLATGEAALGRQEAAIEAIRQAVAADPGAIDPYVADVLRAGASVAAAGGRSILAARLAGAASEQIRREGSDIDAGDRLLLERTLASVREAPGISTSSSRSGMAPLRIRGRWFASFPRSWPLTARTRTDDARGRAVSRRHPEPTAPRRAHEAGGRDPRARRAGQERPGDRRDPRHQPEDRVGPRREHQGQAGARLAAGGRTARAGPRSGLKRVLTLRRGDAPFRHGRQQPPARA